MNEIEEKFFKTLDIQPYERYRPVKGFNFGGDKGYKYTIEFEYPDITDTILLKLICVCSWYDTPYLYQCMYDMIKDRILKMVIEKYKNIPNVSIKNKFKKQVQEVFEEKK